MKDDSRGSQKYSFRACKTNEHQSVNKSDITFENQFDCMYHVTGFQIMGHSAHLGTTTCPSSKLVPKFEKGDNLMKHVYLAYGGNW